MKPTPSLFSSSVDHKTLDDAWKGIGERRVRARRVRRAWTAAPVVVAIALMLGIFLRRPEPSALKVTTIALANGAALPAAWSASSFEVVGFDDGSRVELTQATHLRTTSQPVDPSRVDLVLEKGSATFDIKPGGPRAWVIDAGEAKVRVLGTRFTVVRDREHVQVSVERGKVRVESTKLAGGMRDLVAGESVDVLTVASSALEAAPPRVADAVTPVEALPSGSKAVPQRRPSAVPDPPVVDVAPAPADRMARADEARGAGKPREAVAILTSIVDDGEPRAPLAAFTAGKVYAGELGEQANGAIWFERAIRLGLPVGLEEDAHVRAAECHARAGNPADAARLAAQYEAKFPMGRHLARMKRWKQ